MSISVPCSPFTDGQTDTQTDRVTTEDTLSGFQDFFLQPIIKDRSNCEKNKKAAFTERKTITIVKNNPILHTGTSYIV